MLYLLPRLYLPPKTRGRLRWQGEGDLVGHVAGHAAGTAALALGGLSLQNLRALWARKGRGFGRGRARNFTKLGKAQLKA